MVSFWSLTLASIRLLVLAGYLLWHFKFGRSRIIIYFGAHMVAEITHRYPCRLGVAHDTCREYGYTRCQPPGAVHLVLISINWNHRKSVSRCHCWIVDKDGSEWGVPDKRVDTEGISCQLLLSVIWTFGGRGLRWIGYEFTCTLL